MISKLVILGYFRLFMEFKYNIIINIINIYNKYNTMQKQLTNYLKKDIKTYNFEDELLRYKFTI